MFHNLRLLGVYKKKMKNYLRGFSVDQNNSKDEIHFIISGAKLDNKTLIYTGKIEDTINIKQKSKG